MQTCPAWGAIPVFAALIIGAVAIIVSVLLTVIPFWRICSRAGFPGALSLLILVPVGNLVLLFFLAFAEWPSLKGRSA